MTQTEKSENETNTSVARFAKQKRSRKTQEKILNAAFEAFTENGYEGASINNIAERAGVAQPLVVYHFPSKDALWVASVEGALDQFMKRLLPDLEALKELDPATRLSLIFREFVRYSATMPAMLEIMIDANKRRRAIMTKVVEERLRPVYIRLRALIEAAQTTGAIPAGDPGLIYYSLIAVASTPFSLRREFKQLTGRSPLEPEMVEAQADLLVRLFVPGLE
jgi:TetR/AcrR family transcriptional regulator